MSKENEVVEEKTEEELEAESTLALEGAIDDAIMEVSPHIEEEPDGDNTDADAGADAGTDNKEGEADPDAADAGATGDKDADAEGTGGDSPASDKTDEGGGESGKGEGDGSEVSEETPAEPDHINDPIPEATNEKTAERIRGLIEIAKANDVGTAERDELLQAVVDTGSTPEQYTNSLSFLSLYNSTDPKDRKAALEVARGVVNELSIVLGEGGSDLVARHQDLQDEVDAGTLDGARAIEIATAREAKTLSDSRATHNRETQETTDETNRLITLGRKQLTDFEASMQTDPSYQALRPAFIGVLKETLRTTHPDEWGAKAKTIYEKLKANITINSETPNPNPKLPPTTPLRAKQTAGGGNDKETEAESAEEAVDRALGEM